MKKFICDFFRAISLAGSFFGAIFVMNGAIEKFYAFLIMFGFFFLYFFVDHLDDVTETEDRKDV